MWFPVIPLIRWCDWKRICWSFLFVSWIKRRWFLWKDEENMLIWRYFSSLQQNKNFSRSETADRSREFNVCYMKFLSEKVLTAPIRFVYSSSTKASCEIEDVFFKKFWSFKCRSTVRATYQDLRILTFDVCWWHLVVVVNITAAKEEVRDKVVWRAKMSAQGTGQGWQSSQTASWLSSRIQRM